ncbi:hypothetical protein [Siphonobacter aquaeclarae]|uniref:Uncharacterized protein n=1 Tax=Siphonobacter aquaeclarae TaxID=563176 RepID=A0A1G9T1F6_9BACT|nr:hypothetical protein [Siphonobacter aquaeclarae]SDM41539.1 hypothetical protein SAMN04488090_3377 [Siphonobacter aquaeclarae]
MSKPTTKGSFLARNFPTLFGLLNSKEVDQAAFAAIEKEAETALAASQEAGLEAELEDPEGDPDDEEEENAASAAQASQTAQLIAENAALKKENERYKAAQAQEAAAGRVTPQEDASTRRKPETQKLAANDPMGMALAHWAKNHK